MNTIHSFHIPVMGIGFSIDTPLKAAPFGIDSVISLVDDILLEKLRKMYCAKFDLAYTEITGKCEDHRAKRITSYLNLINDLAEKKVDELINNAIEKGKEIKAYFNNLPDASSLCDEFKKRTSGSYKLGDISQWLKENLSMGSIDVNIMTKVDKYNYQNGEKLPIEYNDAHAALRGFAQSKLTSSIVLSAGMNPALYGYMENFDDFYPDHQGKFQKKIILKVSDYRSAIIQGKYLAKKGLWVSEYRIESGLNCGGHAFASDGYLLGPVLSEFRSKRGELVQEVHQLLMTALKNKEKTIPECGLDVRITAQGGVGTAEEHEFLLDYYQLDSVGWGSPFMLVPEVTNVDEQTLKQLADAKEEDLYLTNISPLGVPFNSLRNNTKEKERLENIAKGRPGSACPKHYVAMNTEFSETGMCIASRAYQKRKLEELDKQKLSKEEHQRSYDKIVEKTCICVGLGTSVLLNNHLDNKAEGSGVAACPGPNLAYFDKVMTLSEMCDHIYGRKNMISRTDRPNMFIREMQIYMDFLSEKLNEFKFDQSRKQKKYLMNFVKNLKEGNQYYFNMFEEIKGKFEESKKMIIADLESCKQRLQSLGLQIEELPIKNK